MNCSRRTRLRFFFVLFLLALGSAAGAAEQTGETAPARSIDSAPRWWNGDWRYRKTVRVTLPDQGNDLPWNLFESSKFLGERSLTGKADILIEGDDPRPGKDIVITDADGKEIPARAYEKGWNHEVTVLFQALPRSADYYIYYGNPKASLPPKNWPRDAYPIQMITAEAPNPDEIQTPARAADALQAAPKLHGRAGTFSVNHPANPFRLEAGKNYITLYAGTLYAPQDGTYQFALDVGGTAHLVIDGSLLLTVQGRAKPAGAWTRRAPIRLAEGMHTFAILHGERSDAQGTRVAWALPGERDVSVMAGSAFGLSDAAPADVTAFEELGRTVTPFFSLRNSDVAFNAPGGKATVAIRLDNLTRGDDLTYRWKVGDQVFHGPSVQCFVPGEGKQDIVLEVTQDDRQVGAYTRAVNFTALRRVSVDAACEMIRCPDIVYSTERAAAAFRVTNRSKSALPIRCERSQPGGEEGDFSKFIDVPPGGEEAIDMDLPMLPPGTDSQVLTFRFWLDRSMLGETDVCLVRPGLHLAAVTAKLGHLFGRDGRRIVLVTDLEDENEYRRWAVLKWARRELRSSPKNILLFGDPMTNVGAPDGGKSYAEILSDRLNRGGRSLTFVPGGENTTVPCIADIPVFAAALAAHNPDLVILCPGTVDAQNGVGRRELARALDALIDLARSQDDPPPIVLASPLPLVSNRSLSQQLAAAARMVARQHHVAFVDLYALVTAQPVWQDAYRTGPDDPVYYLYPNAATQAEFAEAILDAIP